MRREPVAKLGEFPPAVAQALRDLWDAKVMDGATSDMVYEVLHEAIVSGILPPGQRLTEEQLARLFAVSRTPIREAILRLEAERLAERIPRRGLRVSHITPREIIDVYVVREALDGLAAYLAAERATPADVAHLSWINEQFTRAAMAGDFEQLAELNLQFHEAVAQTSQNSLLMEFIRHIHRMVRRFGTTTFTYPGRAISAAQAHQRLVEAIAAHDADLARQIAMEDMAIARQIRILMLQGQDLGPNERA